MFLVDPEEYIPWELSLAVLLIQKKSGACTVGDKCVVAFPQEVIFTLAHSSKLLALKYLPCILNFS